MDKIKKVKDCLGGEGKINEKLTDEVVDTLDTALHRKRLVSFGFVFKEVHKKLIIEFVRIRIKSNFIFNFSV